ncbi:DUF1579 domain-containing protein [Rhizobium sp. RAF56]|jgi:hypothetical protein|uniref:DUF1579 domain-containing protein n=1 Tax=Rhizobium sp. RAF56 TaxID=3233062 RepID=UPI003F960559
MATERSKEHAFLDRLVGRWDLVADATSSNPERGVWRESVRSLNGLWVVCEGHGEMPGGGTATTMLTLGYDPARKKYVGAWIDTVINHLWIYEGSLDEDLLEKAGQTLTLHTSGPDMTRSGETAKYREFIAFDDDDNRTFASEMMTPEGDWRRIMTAQYRRCR